jgi:hypothetical protein
MSNDNNKLQKINKEMERVISGEQEKINESRDQIRGLKEQMLNL